MKYPEKLKLFQQHQKEYKDVKNDALAVTESEDISDSLISWRNLVQDCSLSLVPHVTQIMWTMMSVARKS